MKKIECFIQSKKLTELQDALIAAGVHGMTVSEVKGFGNQQTRPEAYLFLPKTKVEIFATDDQVETLIQVITKVCQTGKSGDGKIAVFKLEDLVRIRTGERGDSAV